MRKVFIFLIMVIPFVLLLGGSLYADVNVISVSPSSKIISLYDKLEIDVLLSNNRFNPFNANELKVDAEFTLPDGSTETVPAFFYGKKDNWKVRYSPRQTGIFEYKICLNGGGKKTYTNTQIFAVKPSINENGFIRKSKNNPYYLTFDNGKSFYGLGHNIGWVTENETSIFESYFQDLQESGCNLTRIWVNCPWTLQIEETIGYYNLTDCAKLDEILSLAKEYGIYIILVLDSYGSLMVERGNWNEGSWESNPHNKVNGGNCNTPDEFFINREAKKHYRNKLRYITARFGYSPNIMAFELWNEVNLPPIWAKDMMFYMKSINPHGQLITTSLESICATNGRSDPTDIWRAPTNDILQRHIYGNQTDDISGYLLATNIELAKKFKKAMLVGEFGIHAQKHDKVCDAKGNGVELHNSLWASVVSGAFSGSLNWWWAGYIRGRNLYHNYRALRNFIEDINWDSKSIQLMSLIPLKNNSRSGKKKFSDLTIIPSHNWGDTRFDEFTVHNNGDIEGGIVNYYLQGISKYEIKIDPVFNVNFPKEGNMIITVGIVSQGACLNILVDDEIVLEKIYSTGSGRGPWEKSSYLPEHKIHQCSYNTRVEIKIPKGKHTIKLMNTGTDWMGLDKISFSGYKTGEFANARAAGIHIDKDMILWIQNRDYNWKNMADNKSLPLIKNSSFDLKDIENGFYDLEWWDTFKGKVISNRVLISYNNKLTVPVPDFSKDIACKIRKSNAFASSEPAR